MKAVIVGDIINSRTTSAEVWLDILKAVLDMYGQRPKVWDIYRGDSFQLMLNAEAAIKVSFHIKAGIKQIDQLDVRLGIGLGDIDFQSDKVTTSNGSAFLRSGESFEALKKQNMLISSRHQNFDDAINTMLGLALYIANRWTPTVSKVIKLAIENPDLRQQELAERLEKSQSNISEALKRGGFDEIMAMNDYYKSEILKL